VPINVKVHDSAGNKLEAILKKTKRKRLELRVILGESGHPARLIAERATPEVAEKRRRERREQARKLGKQPTEDMLVRDGWYLLVTNVEDHLMSASNLFKLYSIRWEIEITFRAWKQSGKLVSALARKSNQVHLQALMLASMLLLILTMKITSLLQAIYHDVHLSIEKIADNLALFILSITSIWHLADYHPDTRHVKSECRSRLKLREIAISCLRTLP
jgi:IS4 transposase